MIIKANGHTGTVESVARAILAENGTSDPHPMLLADTMREVEYHGEIVDETPAADVWTVERDEWEVPCQHPMCALLHRRYFEGSELSTEIVSMPNGDERRIQVRGWHAAKRHHWLVMLNGVRVDSIDPSDTKREAQQRLSRELEQRARNAMRLAGDDSFESWDA